MKELYYGIIYYIQFLKYLNANKVEIERIGFQYTKLGLIYKTIQVPNDIKSHDTKTNVAEIFIFNEFNKFTAFFPQLTEFIDYETLIIDEKLQVYELQMRFNAFDIDKFASNLLIYSAILGAILSAVIYHFN